MSWARYDDEWNWNRKVAFLRSRGIKGMAALGLHLGANTWSRHQGARGNIPDYILPELAGKAGAELARLLAIVPPGCTTGMFERNATDDGWLIHDYAEYHDPNDQAPDRSAAERRSDLSAKRAEAGRRGGLAKAGKAPSKPASKRLANSQQPPTPEPEPEPVPSEPVSDDTQPSVSRAAGGGDLAHRHAAIAAAYARLIADSTPGVRHRGAFMDDQIRKVMAIPATYGTGTELARLAALFPTAPPSAVAAWLTGDKHSMSVYARADELEAHGTEPEGEPPRLRLVTQEEA